MYTPTTPTSSSVIYTSVVDMNQTRTKKIRTPALVFARLTVRKILRISQCFNKKIVSYSAIDKVTDVIKPIQYIILRYVNFNLTDRLHGRNRLEDFGYFID